ncbi:hypothetical protein EV645_0377 [Kribbella rubisoli]|uniref:Uncharacterized protein n=1 Tax=Kribbella rubisoli TaxID=3075929 RepID=A0A4V2FZP5_9ACTN|nr:hypothetical protein [Kribbella rubisoli]RZU22296.1 hypothetical protein EV645_0377 [Kribbella rubisoli]
MTAKYHLILDPDLRDELRELQARARANPNGPAAKQFEAVRIALSALREGREAEFAGERLGRSDNHPDLRDCAEIKIPVVEEFNRRGRPMGPSHRVSYREFEGPTESSLPVRQVVAFAPRKNGEIFDVTANRLGRSKGVALDELDHLPTVRPITGPGKEPDRLIGPPRMALPPDLAQSLKALEGLAPPTSTPPTTTNHPPTPQRQPPNRGPSQSR